jgi:hypothetical protein
MYAMEWTADGAMAYSGPHVVVNPEMPDYAPMQFINGKGVFIASL